MYLSYNLNYNRLYILSVYEVTKFCGVFLNNYKLTIQYDGTNYAGWQIQQNAVTVQQKIQDAVKIILKDEINLIGSGRTDAGVHSWGQIANFQTLNELDTFKFNYSLNSILPKDISIIKIEKEKEDFHSRFDAVKRSYFYLFSKHKSPFFFRYSYFYHENLNVEQLNKTSKILLGKRDFSSFSKKQTETKNKVCDILTAQWKESNGLIFFLVEADRFLHGMVRTIVGTLLHSVKQENPQDYLTKVIEAKDREAAAESAPAKGLFLYKVRYIK